MIYNFTQHNATEDQIASGVQSTPNAEIKSLLNFVDLPSASDLKERAQKIAELAKIEAKIAEIDNYTLLVNPPKCMIAGAPFFMSHLECELKEVGFIVLYAFSQRVSVERHNEDGTVTKQNVFKHIGFIEA